MVNPWSSFEQNYDGQESPMLITKFRRNRLLSGTRNEDFEGFYHVWGMVAILVM